MRSSTDCEFARISPHYAEQVGFSNEELASKDLLEWIHPEDQVALREAIESGEGQTVARHCTRDAGWLELEWQVKTTPRGVAVIGLVPGDQPRTQELVTQTRGASSVDLTKTLIYMARIVESKNPGMMCSILLVDETGEHVSVGAGPSLPKEYNAAVEGLRIGPTVGSCGTAAFWNIPVVVEDIENDPLWRELAQHAKKAGVAACWSHPITTTNGEVLGAMALYESLPSGPKQHHMDGLEIAARMVGLAIERDRLEEQLRQGAKMEALGVLAGGIAHDFNNMLAAVLGNAELALKLLSPDSEAVPMLNEIATASVSASELCTQMLAYAGRGALTEEAIDCNSLVSELGALLQVALAKKAELEYELSEEVVSVCADRSQLRQVIMNLITNASEAIGNNEGVIGIGTSCVPLTRDQLQVLAPDRTLEPGDYVQLWVSDTGRGMKPTTRQKMFDPFFSTKSTGRGLGLAAVQGIVRRHEGVICVEGGHGSGTKFSVFLPKSSDCETIETIRQDDQQVGDGTTILVVDDEPAVRNILVSILKRAGYEILSASDGQEAIEVYREHGADIDCVLLDLSMPKLDGDEVFAELKKLRSDVRVILSSGFTEQQIMSRFKDSGLAGVVQKPTQMSSLLDKVAQAIK